MRSRSFVVAALLLLAPTLAITPTADACATDVEVSGVPCGRIYPFILIRIADQEPRYDIAQGEEVEWEATLTYKFSINDNGYTVALPNDPVKVTFEYPRLPEWVDLSVAPDTIEIPVNDPTYLKPNADDPNNVQAEYEYSTTITIKARLNGQQPVLRDGYEFAKLLVFAKSTESGLYQSGYGIKEIRIVPEGHVFESDVAGSKDVFTATPLQPATGNEAVAWIVAGTGVSVALPAEVPFWQPVSADVRISRSLVATPEDAGRVFFSVVEESGATIAQHGPVPFFEERAFNVTFVRPGAHLFAVTLLPGAGSLNPPVTFLMRMDVGDVAPEGYEFPKSYVVTQRNVLPPPVANTDDPLVQFEHEIPFFAFDSAQSTVASVALVTPGGEALGKAAANLEFVVVDDQGKQLQANTVDPSNPVRPIRIGSLPGDGWYALRVRGTGAPDAAAYDVRIEASYALPAQARNHADLVPDHTGGLLALGGRNVTLPIDALQVWTPSDMTPTIEGHTNADYWLTITDAATQRTVYASGHRASEPTTFAAPAPGTYHATVYAEPNGSPAFAPLARTFTFTVGQGTDTVASTYAIEDTLHIPTTPTETLLGIYRLPTATTEATLAGTATTNPTTTLRYVLVNDEGKEIATADDPATLGTIPAGDEAHTLHIYATNRGPAATANLAVEANYPEPITLNGITGEGTEPAPTAKIPNLALGIGLALIGGVAVALAITRRT